jgi:hypothetical protein
LEAVREYFRSHSWIVQWGCWAPLASEAQSRRHTCEG